MMGARTAFDEALSAASRDWPVFPVHTVRDGCCSCGNGACQSPAKHPLTADGFKSATTDEQAINVWVRQFDTPNWGMATGSRSGVFVLDIDPKNGGEESLLELEATYGKLPDTPTVLTGSGGQHLYFRAPSIPLKNTAGRLGDGIDTRGEGGYVVLPGSLHISGRAYRWKVSSVPDDMQLADVPPWLLTLLTAGKQPARKQNEGRVSEGRRHETLVSRLGSLFNAGLQPEELLAAAMAWNQANCDPPLPDDEVRRTVASTDDWQVAGGVLKPPPRAFDTWPQPMAEAAYHGIMGDIVRHIEADTEASPEALLIHALVMAGSAIGRGPHAMAGKRHGGNLFGLLVGPTGKGRKGSAEGPVRDVFRLADPEWARRIRNGLSSGEGLIAEVKDATEGPDDKRVMVIETELSSLLKRMGQQGNTLSAILRVAWDGDDLHTVTKNSPLHATGPHICLVGHSSEPELRELITDISLSNGFLNRFLIVCTKRVQILPEGGQVLDSLPLIARLRDALEVARRIDLVRRDEGTREVWASIYEKLSGDKPGLVGQALNRAEAQVLRLQMLFAVMDGSAVIQLPHLEAALAVWDYCEASVRHIFGDKLGNKDAVQVRDLVRVYGPLTRTDLHTHLHRNWPAARLQNALRFLLDDGWVKGGFDGANETFDTIN